MTKTVRRLSGLEIDEVSLVDRPANQHGLVAITKRDEGPMTKLYDRAGNEVSEDDLQVGDIVFNEEGEALRALSEEEYAELEAMANEGGSQTEQEYEENELLDSEPSPLREMAEAGAGVGKSLGGRAATTFLGGAHKLGNTTGRQRAGAAAIAGGASATGAVIHGRRKGRLGYTPTAKSLGAEVLEELSKALTDDDRDQVIAKAAERIGEAQRVADQAMEIAKAQADRAEHAQYVELAKSYELPVEETELGGILQKISKALTPEELDTVDRILLAAGDALLQPEVGSAGYQPSYVMGQVEGYVGQVVGKSDGMTQEQATVALFEANPEAYDAYLSEKG